LLWVLAVASMTVGNLIALRQTNIVRLLGYSSIAQGGFILVPFAMAASYDTVGLSDAFFASVTYVLIYAFMNLGAFAVVIAVAAKTESGEIEDWGGLNRYAPGLAALLGLFFFSLAGIPPLAGWFAKFVMFRAVIGVFESPWAVALAVIAAVNAVIALVYYAKVVKTVYMDAVPVTVPVDRATQTPVPRPLALAIGVTAAMVVIVGFFPQVLGLFGEISERLVAGP
ncbi:MAG: proton-conducting transporter membrane subunit, partial [Acidimicrobiia bacterium]